MTMSLSNSSNVIKIDTGQGSTWWGIKLVTNEHGVEDIEYKELSMIDHKEGLNRHGRRKQIALFRKNQR